MALDMQEARTADDFDWLSGDGEMAGLIRSFNWNGSELGPVRRWSPALKTTLRIMLANRFPHILWWGPRHIQFYNDAYIPITGSKHPRRAFGVPGDQGWSEIWHIIGPLVERPFKGGAPTWDEDIRLEINRHGFVEETHFTVAYSPVPDDSAPGGIGGVLGTVHEITGKVVGERRVRALRDLAHEATNARSEQQACDSAADVLSRHGEDVPFALIYLLSPDGTQADLVCSSGGLARESFRQAKVDIAGASGDGLAPLFADVVRTQQSLVASDLAARLDGVVPPGPYADPPVQAMVVPVRATSADRLAGLLVAGVSARLALDDAYRSFLELVAGQVAAAIATARAYEEERRRAEALAEIDRAKTAFFSNVSHEFRTPLTLMLGPLEEAARRDGLDEATRKDLATAHGNALRLSKLVNALLDFARVEAGRAQATYRPTDIGAATAHLASSFRSLCERAGLDLRVDCASLSQPVHLDHDMWEKIVLNLVSNAFKFTLAGGIAVTLGEQDGHAVLRVADTGVGIPEADLPRIFERFHRIEGVVGRSQEGSGIGLALVQELVRLHGGSVSVESTPGKGSIFTVRIPFGTSHLPSLAADRNAAPASTAIRPDAFVAEASQWISRAVGQVWEAEGPMPATVREDAARVLVADDNADMREYLVRLLSPHYRVEAVDNGEAALAAARSRAPALVVADVMMPRLDGFGLLSRIRDDAGLRGLPVILLSARAGEAARVEGLAAGADDYLTKPFSARELLARIESALKLAELRRQANAEMQARLREFEALVDASSDVVYRMSPDWSEMRFLLGRDFIADTPDPSRTWLEKYIDPQDQPRVIEAIAEAIRSKSVFELEHRVRRVDGSLGWTFSRAIPLLDDKGDLLEWLGMASDVTERKSAQEQQALLVRELSHRVKNLFAVATGMIGLTARFAKSPRDMADTLQARLGALARAQELALPSAGGGRRAATLAELVDVICFPYQPSADPKRLSVSGAEVPISGPAVTSLALVLNELATNAAKHGALSAPKGSVDVSWCVDGGRVVLTWAERGGPPLAGVPPTRGFGNVLSRASVEGQLGGTIAYDWRPSGLVVTLQLPTGGLSR